MLSSGFVNRFVGAALGLGSLVFVALLGGVGAAQFSEEPPEVSPYESGPTSLYDYESVSPTSAGAQQVAPLPEREVVIKDFAFDPAALVVPMGTTITFVNREVGVGHTSTSEDGSWKSGTLNPDETFSFTFEAPGTFSYFCSIHPSMKAKITIEG